jgi:2',3'-cyclic-nucleotide 2'-phosphodiesterase (5'-nucleotidase family)
MARWRLARCFAVLVLLAWGAGARGEELTLTVLFTSDMHAHLLPQDDVRQRPARGSVAQVASLVAAVRRENPLVVVLDGGDAIQGTPMAHYVLAGRLGEGEDPTVAAMNLVGYDAATVGNHEFNYGLPPLRRAVSQSRFPWLAANLENTEAAALPVKPWVVLQRGPVRVGVVGISNPRVPFWDPPEHWQPLAFADPLEKARQALAQLRPQVDVLILVAHTGFERDPRTGEGDEEDEENFAWRLAQLPGVDLLLTGHTHQDIPPQKLGRTWVAQPGRWAELVTRFDLHLVREGERFRLVRVEGRNVPVDRLPADPRVEQALASLHQKVLAELARPLGELAQPLLVRGLPVADDPSVDLVHRVQLWATGAQLSLAAPLAPGNAEFPPGALTPRLAHALYPYPNTLVVVRVTGKELAAILEHAVRGYRGIRCTPPAPCELLRDQRLPTYNFDTLEGASYLVDPTAPQGQRIRKLEVGGKPVAPGDVFTLVVNSYRAAGGGGYPYLREAPRVKVVDRQMVDLLVEYFQTVGRLVPEASENWFFAPRLVLAPRAAR